MGVIGNYYLNGPTLASSTYVYLDAALTTPAPLGYYGSGGLYREVINASGELGPLTTCPSCVASCPVSIINDMSGPGFYTLEVNLGTSTGAVLITYTPRSSPHGILTTYQGNTYNELSSPVDGYHTAASPVRATYLGDSTDACSIGLVSGSPYAGVPDYNWYDTSYYATGLQTNVFVAPNDASFTTAGAPGDCVMVVPKLVNVTGNLLIQMPVPSSCASAANISVACPVKLTSFQAGKINTICGDAFDRVFYNAPVNGTPGNPALYDWVFTDPNGETVLEDGDYLFDIGATGSICTMANGIITNIAACPP
jgi:ferredoxin